MASLIMTIDSESDDEAQQQVIKSKGKKQEKGTKVQKPIKMEDEEFIIVERT